MTAAATASSPSPDPVRALVAAANRHARLRWVGAPLLLSGVAQLGWALLSLGRGGAFWYVMFAMFGTGMGLASFGANHDTAMALALKARRAGATEGGGVREGPLSRELDQELARDAAGTTALSASPKIAMGLPVVALLVQAYVGWQLLNL